MGNSASALPYSIDNQIGAPHDHNGWSLHNGKSTDGRETEVSVFVGKKPQLAKQPASPRHPQQTQLVPALHHYNYCRKLRHPHILKIYATLDTDNPNDGSTEGGPATPPRKDVASNKNETGDLMIVTEPCVSLDTWLLSNPSPDQLAWGLECVIRGLHFLHSSANLAHGNLSPSSFYVTRSGDVKLWNFNLVTPIGPNVGPNSHFQQWEEACTMDAYRSPERVQKRYDLIRSNGVNAIDAYALGILIDHWFQGRIPLKLQKAVQRLQTPNIKMRPRVQPLLKCPVFDTTYQKLQITLEDLIIQPVEQKIQIWQNLGSSLQSGTIAKDVALYKLLTLIQNSIMTICGNETMLVQDLYRREVLAMLLPLFFIVENYLDKSKVSKELSPLIALLFKVKDRGVRGALLGKVEFMSKHLTKNSLNSDVFEPLCSGFNDSSAALREMTLKATLGLVDSLNAPNLEKLTRYLVRLQADTETSIRTNAVIFVSKIAPQMSEISREKHLLPAYIRSMKDTFPPARLAAIQALIQSKDLFTPSDVANKVLPAVIPLLLDPITNVRNEAFQVVNAYMTVLQTESLRLANMARQQEAQAQYGGESSQTTTTTAPPTTSEVAPAPSSGSYMYGAISWMAGSTQPTEPTSTASTTAPPKQVAPAPSSAPIPMKQQQQPPVQQFAATTLSAPAPVVDDGWGDDADGWGDDDDEDDDGDNDDPFAHLGVATAPLSKAPLPTPQPFNPSKQDDDPFAAIGMKQASSVLQGGSGKLIMNKKKKGGLVLPKPSAPAKKLGMSNDDLLDGWDDF